MARAGHSGTVVGSAVVVREKYYWPDLQLNIWTIVMLATAGTILGVNAQFMQIQDRMELGTPWYVSQRPAPHLQAETPQQHNANNPQDHALRRHSRRARHHFHHHRNRLHRATQTPPKHHDAALLYPTRALHRWHHWNSDTALRRAEHQQPVQYICIQRQREWAEHGYTCVLAAEEYLYVSRSLAMSRNSRDQS